MSGRIANLYLPHYKTHMRNYQPIYNTLPHIFNDTTCILFLHTFVRLLSHLFLPLT